VITMNDFRAEPPALTEAMLEATRRVLASGWYVLGPELRQFEAQWAARCDTPHCLGVANGLDAIELILRALQVGPGDEVITTSMTAFATVLAVIRAGATPVLADIDPRSGLLDPASAERCITPRTKALVLVHLYGQVRGMDTWQSLCATHGIVLVEDCAQAHLARSRGRAAGSIGVAGAYSFYPTKNLGAIGDAGAVVTGSDDLAARVSRLRNYGQSERYHHPELGMNSRLDELQAALLGARLDWLDAFTQRRRDIAQRYRDTIPEGVVELLDPPEEPDAHVHHLFVVRSDRRDELQAHLASQNVQSLVHYPVPVHRQPPCAGVAHDPAGMAHTERHAAQCLSLPCHPQMHDGDVDQVVDALRSFPTRR
jgi:dTDP-4-amino-4,6-dideoxygalactose transaminase